MIITVANHKGGVAKTSTVLAIAEIVTYLQKENPEILPEEYRQKPVLVIDIDPQANATEALGIDPAEVKISVQQFLEMPENTVELADVRYGILKTKFDNIYLIPSSISIEPYVHRLAGEMDGAMRLSVVTKHLADRFSLVLIDTPPNLGLFTQNALVAADGVLVPISLSKHAIMGIQNLVSIITSARRFRTSHLPALLGYLIVGLDKRYNLHQSLEVVVRQSFGSDVFDTVIPTQAKVAENISKRRSVLYGLTLQQKEDWLSFIGELFDRAKKVTFAEKAV
ncbi:ParA family protein [Acetomicrobium sp.]|jgi:chromosome partitioning protein|uniref:ParA family protein n=1 Tax=Acetomicrobium sp. TaxID=1872099 RepID=UPI00287145EE|nr:ParA family protein [Acetomicrobium sp.]MDR9768882.1 ParA family protein [Acetomicrobium sp.]